MDIFSKYWLLEQRTHSGENQIIPFFVRRVIQLLGIETFLPPIPCPITKFKCKTIYRAIHLSKISNMKYTGIAVDVGTEEKYYKAIWNNPDEFKMPLYISGIFMLSCIFLVIVENLLLSVALKTFYIGQECVQWVE